MNTLPHRPPHIDAGPWLNYKESPSPQHPNWIDSESSATTHINTTLEAPSKPVLETADETVLGEEISKRLEALYMERLDHNLKKGVWTTFKFLFATLLTSHVRRGFSIQAAQTTGHLAVRLLCVELSLSPTTAYDHLAKLKAAGLLDFRSFKTAAPQDWVMPERGRGSGELRKQLRQPVLNTGTLVAIRLLPGFLKPVRLRKDDFEVSPRDLHSDLLTGNTVRNYTESLSTEQVNEYKARKARWKDTGHIYLPQGWSVDIAVLVDFTLPAEWLGKAPLFVSVQFSSKVPEASSLRGKLLPEDMFSLPNLPPSVAREWIDAIGVSIQEYLGDRKGQTVWHGILWQLYRHAKHGANRFSVLFDQLSRVKSEFNKRECSNPAASVIKRLRNAENSFWDWLQDAPSGYSRITGASGSPIVV